MERVKVCLRVSHVKIPRFSNPLILQTGPNSLECDYNSTDIKKDHFFGKVTPKIKEFVTLEVFIIDKQNQLQRQKF